MPTFFKDPPQSQKIRNATRAKKRKAQEEKNMQAVRRRDRYCRFPLCRCGKFRLQLQVSHSVHRGMGGNPAGDRSHPDRLVLLCSARHQENIVAIDNGTLRWREIGRDSAGHPMIAWEVNPAALMPGYIGIASDPQWFELAREVGLHSYETFSHEQLDALRLLSQMEL